MKTLGILGSAALAMVGAVTGCAETNGQPVVASSATQVGYAQAYPEALQGASKRLADDRADARQISAGLPTRLGEVKTPADPNLALDVIDRSDQAGRSYAYASRYEGAQATRELWDDERGAVTGRVAAAAQSKVNDAKCENVDVTGAVSGSLREAMDRQIERRTRAASDVPLLLEKNKGALGAANVAALQKLSDDVAKASYLVNVALDRDRDEVARLAGERQAVDATLQSAIDDERRYQSQKGRTEAEKRAAEERIGGYTKSRAALGGASVNAQATTSGIDEQIRQAQAGYDAALQAMRDDLRARASGSAAATTTTTALPPPPSGSTGASVNVSGSVNAK